MRTQAVKIQNGNDADELSAVLSMPDGYIAKENRQTLIILAHDIPFGHSHDHDNLYPFLRTVFDDRGLQTLMFDFESCGGSNGDKENFTLDVARRNLQAVLTWAGQHGFNRFIFVGAGITAAICLELTDKTTKSVFLFWPVVDIAAYAKRLTDKNVKIHDAMFAQMNAYNPEQAMKSLKVPVLIQYGANDDVVGIEQIETIKTRFNALRIDITSYMDGGHGLLDPKHRKMMGHHIGQFLHKYA